MPARVPAEVKELVLKTVDDAVAAGFSPPGRARCGGFQTRGYTAGGLAAVTPAPWSTVRRAGTRCTRCCPGRSPRSLDIAERWGAVDRSPASSLRLPTSSWCGCHRRPFPPRADRPGTVAARPQPRSRSARNRGRTGWNGNRTGSGYGTPHISRDPAGSASRSWTWCLASGSTPWSAWRTATQVQVMFEHALEVGACWNCSPMSGSTSTPTIPAGRSCWPSPTTGPPMTARDTRAFMA